ncbi:MAG: hypothetical protein ACOC2E_07875 [Bacteroidota bacterium]
MTKRRSLIHNRHQLAAIKEKLEDKVHTVEKDFVKDFDTLSVMLNTTGVYKNKKHGLLKQDIHALIVQSISTYLQDMKPFGKDNERLNQLLIPSITVGLSVLVVNFFRNKSNQSH